MGMLQTFVPIHIVRLGNGTKRKCLPNKCMNGSTAPLVAVHCTACFFSFFVYWGRLQNLMNDGTELWNSEKFEST